VGQRVVVDAGAGDHTGQDGVLGGGQRLVGRLRRVVDRGDGDTDDRRGEAAAPVGDRDGEGVGAVVVGPRHVGEDAGAVGRVHRCRAVGGGAGQGVGQGAAVDVERRHRTGEGEVLGGGDRLVAGHGRVVDGHHGEAERGGADVAVD